MTPVIRIENLSKQYRLGLTGTGTLSHDLNRWWHLVRGKEDPYLKIGEVNDRTTKGTSEYVWALKDINLEAQQGEVLGIIGKNGAGKSTLLKILSKVTAPTTGSITYKGRIGSLLEVGTGFHQELTGRENIYLNGAILGMQKREIKKKFDEIVDFSGCERYIDTPVKRYSSGMMVRLGFAVAAFLEPEILVVDEVLAVGDAEFQKKAIGKMQDVSRNDGRTVLFVSHNMGSIRALCNNGILLKNGQIEFVGKITNVIDYYLMNELPDIKSNVRLIDRKDRTGNGKIRISDFYVQDEKGEKLGIVQSGQNIFLVFEYESDSPDDLRNIDIGFSIHRNDNTTLSIYYSSYDNVYFNDLGEKGQIKLFIKNFFLSKGEYRIGARILNNNEEADWPRDGISTVIVESGNFYLTPKGNEFSNLFLIKGEWSLFKR
jgi:lipopolysaccharide transport system ATP-binding protein